MERDKRRSKEEEEELDRKIALIREKNQKIEERSKEVEADRASNTTAAPKKPSPSVQKQPAKSKDKVWDREWDKGKTPADQWRENVPSIEHSGRLASATGGQQQQQQNQQQRRRQNGQGSQPQHIEKLNKGRLEGRVTVAQDKPAGNRNRGRREGQQNTKQVEKGEDKPVKTSTPRNENRNRRRGNSEKAGGDVKEKSNDDASKEQEKSQKKSRPRRENDRYAVRMVVKQLVDKVDKIERRRKRDEQRDEEGNEEKTMETESKMEEVTPTNEDKENESTDANQNVIELTRERILTVQST